MNQYEVDKWVEENDRIDSYALLDEKLPKARAKLNRLDRRIRDVIAEIREEFPDAVYYTGGGGFSVVLGHTHDNSSGNPMRKRLAWYGRAEINDGDW